LGVGGAFADVIECYDLFTVYASADRFSPTLFTFYDLTLFLGLQQSWVGILLIKQPFFVGGIDDVENAKGSAFGAAASFFFTFLISIMYMIKEGRRLDDHSDRPSRDGGARGDYGQLPAYRDYNDAVADLPETLSRGAVFT
jgi:hypothetical protein